VPKFRSRRTIARRPSQEPRRYTLAEVAEESPERQEPEDDDVQLKRSSAPVRRTPDTDDVAKSLEECVILLSKKQPSASAEPASSAHLPRTVSEKGRGKLQRQDESIV